MFTHGEFMHALKDFTIEELQKEIKVRQAFEVAERLVTGTTVTPEGALSDKNALEEARGSRREFIRSMRKHIEVQQSELAHKLGLLNEEIDLLNDDYKALVAWQDNRWKFR
jgi:hypothetical protein